MDEGVPRRCSHCQAGRYRWRTTGRQRLLRCERCGHVILRQFLAPPPKVEPTPAPRPWWKRLLGK